MDTSAKVNKENNVLLEWESESRPFRPRSKEFYKTAVAIVALVSIILVFIGEFLLIGVIIATFFVMYVLSTVPPEKIKHKFTTLGIETGDHFHKWEEMSQFWFDEKNGQKILVVKMLLGFPSHLQLLFGNVSEEKVREFLGNKIPFREKPEKTFLDNPSTWLSQKIPLERTS